MYYRSDCFNFNQQLESQWQVIRDELDHFLAEQGEDSYADYPTTIPYSNKWKLLGIFSSEKGSSGIPDVDEQMKRNSIHFPKTVELVKQIPGILHAGFSKIVPGTVIRPHKENYGKVLRCHLGLKVVEQTCGFMVAGKTKYWREGKCLYFDGNAYHEAWNRGDEERIVLLIDFDRDVALQASGRLTDSDPEGLECIEPYSLSDRISGVWQKVRSRHHRSKLRAARKAAAGH